MKNDYAVVKIGKSQYLLHQGDEILIEKIDGKAGDIVTFESVLLKVKGGKATLGTPTIEKAKVEVKVMEQMRGKKIEVLKFKAKSRYRRRMGHRQYYTKIIITKV